MRIKNLVLGIGIVVVYALVLWQGIAAFYPQPMYEDFCDYVNTPRAVPLKGIEGDINCVYPVELDSKANACYKEKGEFRYEYDENGCVIDGYCDECSILYNDASDKYSRNVFIISLIIGVITFIFGFTLLKIEPVGSALIGSGIYAVFYGTVWNWRNFGAGVRFGLLLLVLVLLIWIALRMNRRREKSWKFWKR
jgi:hypothetical protein